MGNQIGVCAEAPNIADLFSGVINEQESNISPEIDFFGFVQLWRIHPSSKEDNIVIDSPVRLPSFKKFDSNECYIVLHLSKSSQSTARGSSNPSHLAPSTTSSASAPSTHLNSSTSSIYHELFSTSISELTPRGLASSFGTITLDPFLHGTTTSSNSLANEDFVHDLYIWNGRNATSLTKAVALAKGFEIERKLTSEDKFNRALFLKLSQSHSRTSLTDIFSEFFHPHPLNYPHHRPTSNGAHLSREVSNLCDCNHLVRQLLHPLANANPRSSKIADLFSSPHHPRNSSSSLVAAPNFEIFKRLSSSTVSPTSSSSSSSSSSTPPTTTKSGGNSRVPLLSLGSKASGIVSAEKDSSRGRSPPLPSSREETPASPPNTHRSNSPVNSLAVPIPSRPSVSSLIVPTKQPSQDSPVPILNLKLGSILSSTAASSSSSSSSSAASTDQTSPNGSPGSSPLPSPNSADGSASVSSSSSASVSPSVSPSISSAPSIPSLSLNAIIGGGGGGGNSITASRPATLNVPALARIPLASLSASNSPRSPSRSDSPPTNTGPSGSPVMSPSSSGSSSSSHRSLALSPPRPRSPKSPIGRRNSNHRLQGPNYSHMSQTDLLAVFEPQLSKITDQLYLGSRVPASTLSMLKPAGITHVVNCAGTVCSEYFPDEFRYLTLCIADGSTEDIACLIYEVIEFIDTAISSGGKVFVHCHQGVSRSSAFVISYLMWKFGWTFGLAHQHTKDIRFISNPNPGFTGQLMLWFKRLKSSPGLDQLNVPVSTPRTNTTLYRIAPAHMNMLLGKEVKKDGPYAATDLDPRGCFILCTSSRIFFWRGSQCPDSLVEAGRKFVSRLQRYEHASLDVIDIVQGQSNQLMDKAFWEALGVGSVSNVTCNTLYDRDYEATQVEATRQRILAERQEMAARQSRIVSGGSIDTSLASAPEESPAKANCGLYHLTTTAAGSGDDQSDGDSESDDDDDGVGEDQGPMRWEHFSTYDEDDLDGDGLFVLRPSDQSCIYLWIGESFEPATFASAFDEALPADKEKAGLMIGRRFLQQHHMPTDTAIQLITNREQESDQFWDVFDDATK